MSDTTQTPTKSSPSSPNEETQTEDNSSVLELLSDEGPLLALLEEDLSLWDDPEKAREKVNQMQALRQSPQTFKAALNAESDVLERKRPAKKREALTPEQKQANALAKLMSDLL